MSSRTIIQLWQTRKLTHEVVRQELVKCRCPGARRAFEFIDWVRSQERVLDEDRLVRRRAAEISVTLRPSVTHPVIEEWMQNFSEQCRYRMLRHRPLLLVGASGTGKTRKAISLFGDAATFCVCGQGLDSALPDLRGFNPAQHRAILWDEMHWQQVTANRLVFQSPPERLVLAQSACHAHAYSVLLHGVAMIICSNYCPVRCSECVRPPWITQEQEDWLVKNVVVVVKLADGETWYL